jgi:hypothetical protein
MTENSGIGLRKYRIVRPLSRIAALFSHPQRNFAWCAGPVSGPKLFHVEHFERPGTGKTGKPARSFERASKLFHVEQFTVNGKAVENFVGSPLVSISCNCRELWCFVPCYSEWGFFAAERRNLQISARDHLAKFQ